MKSSFNFFCFLWSYILYQKLNQVAWMRLLLMLISSPKHVFMLKFGIVILLTTCENQCHLEIMLWMTSTSFSSNGCFFGLAPYEVISSREVSTKSAPRVFLKKYCLTSYYANIKSIRQISMVRSLICCTIKPLYFIIK